MAYEISSSVAASTFSTQTVTSAVTNGFEHGGKFSPDGTKMAVSTYRHGGAASTDHGIDIYTSSSASGWARTESIDATTAPGHLEWFSDNNIFSIQGSYVRNYISSSVSGWAAGEVIVATGGDYYMEFNPSKTILATWSGTNQYYRSIYSGSGNWTSTADLKGGNYGDLESLAWISDDTVALGYPENSSYRGILLTYKTTNGGSSYSMAEYLNGDSTQLPGMGASLYYHTASNSLLVGTRDGAGEGVHADNKLVLFQSSSAAGILPASYTSHTVIDSGKRVYKGPHTAIQYGNGDRILMVTHDDAADDADLVAIESGSAGWKVTVIDGDIRDPGTDGNLDISSLGAVASNDTTAGVGQATFLVRQMIQSNPALATSVTSTIGSSGGTVSAGDTESSPAASVTIPASALGSNVSIMVDLSTNATPKTNGLGAAGLVGVTAYSPVVEVTPHNQQFSAAVTLSFKLSGSVAGTKPANLEIYKSHTANGPWYRLPTAFYSCSEGGVVSLSATSFSRYQAIGGNNMARTKIGNSQIAKFVNADVALAVAMDLTGSNSTTPTYVSATDLFLLHRTGSTSVAVSASVMQDFFSKVDVSDGDGSGVKKLVFVTAAGSGVDLFTDSDGISFDTTTDTLVATNLSASTEATLASAIVEDLTSGRIVLAGTSGAIEDSANLLFNGSQLSVTGVVSGSSNFQVGGTLAVNQAASFVTHVSASGDLRADGGQITSDESILNIGTDDDTNALQINASYIKVTNGMSASSTSSGAFQVNGGVGISEKLYVGNTANIAGATTITDSTESSTTGTGALIIYGGVGVGADLNVGDDLNLKSDSAVLSLGQDADVTLTHDGTYGLDFNVSGSFDLDAGSAVTIDAAAASHLKTSVGALTLSGASGVTIQGDLTVQGTTTTVSTEEVTIADHNIVLDSNNSTADVISGAGITLEGGSGDDITFQYDGSAKMALKKGSSLYTLQLGALDADSASTIASLKVDDLTSGRVVLAGTDGEIEDSGNLTFNGSQLSIAGTVSGSAALQGASVAVDGSIAGAAISGSGAAQFATMHSDSVNIDGGAIDGTIIGASSRAAISGTSISGSGAAQFATMHSDSVNIDGGAIDGTIIGANAQAAGEFTTVSGSGNFTVGADLSVAASASLEGNIKPDGASASTLTVSAHSVLFVDGDGLMKKASVSSMATSQAGSGLAASSGQFNIDVSEFSAVTPAASDSFLTLDSDGSSEQRTTTDALATLFAGNGLSAASAVMALDLSELTAASVNVANDSIAIVDADDSNGSKKESIADLASAMAGNGITSTSGVFSIDYVESVKLSASAGVAEGTTVTIADNYDSALIQNSFSVYLNGMLQTRSGSAGTVYDYAVSGTSVVLEASMDSDDVLVVKYIKNG